MYTAAPTTSLVLGYVTGALNSVSGGTYSNHAAQIDISILGTTIPRVTIDTGSTGIAIASNLLPTGALAGYTPLGPGTINYDSSGVSPSGTFYELPVSLLNGTSGGSAATASTTVKVLVVTNEASTAYFGIGNNRNNVYSGAINPSLTFQQNVAQGILTPISAVGMNPLLNVSVNGAALTNQGYVVMNDRIVVGLTTANNGYSFVKLTPDAANGPNLWNGIPVSLTVGSGAAGAGTILNDTGIDYAFLTPFGQTGQTVSVAMPGASPTGAFYDFVITRGIATTPPPCATTAGATMTPCFVSSSTSSTPFLNTGRQFYAGLNYLFDPVNGFVGYALSDSGLTTSATVTPLLSLTGAVTLSNGFSSTLPTYLFGSTSVSVASAETATINAVITGPNSLTLDSGTLVLGAANTYSGGTIVSGGTLRLGAGGSLLATGALAVNGGTFDLNGNSQTVGALSGTGGTIALGAGTLTANSASSTSLAATITGSGAFVKQGTGTLTLLGANTYAGGTTVSAGVLQGNTTSLQRAIVNNASVTFNQSTNGTYAGNMSGTGSLMKQGTGTVILTGTNSYTGGTTVSGGTLQGNTTSLQGAITNNASVVFDQATAGTYAGNMSGSGTFTKMGAGVLTVSGNNSYSGGTTVSAGTLRLGSANALPTMGALTVNGGSFDLNGFNLTVGSLAGTGGTISLGTGTLIADDAGSTTFAGTLTGTGGITKTGSGTLNLTGTNTYTGPTTVSGGRLAVNGSITSNVTVGAGGNLGGTGTITGTVNNNGIVAPGNSIGTLNVSGSYTQAAESTYQVETNSAGQADRINVSGAPGTATINGGTVTVTGATGVYAMSTTYTILNATGGVTGTFANANSLFPFLQPSLSYDANNVYLTLKPGGFGAGAATPNQAAVGRVLDQSVAGASGDLATVIGTMATYTSAQGQAAMNAISGQNYSGFGTANLGGGLLFMNALGQQMGLARGGFGGGTRVAVAQACDVVLADSEACDGEASPWSLWGSAMGGTGSVAGNGNAGTLTYNAGGVATGVDYRFDPGFLAGIGVGFSSGNQWASGFSGLGTTSSYQASLYASFTRRAFYLDGLAGYGYNDNQMTRQIALPNLAARTAQGVSLYARYDGEVATGTSTHALNGGLRVNW